MTRHSLKTPGRVLATATLFLALVCTVAGGPPNRPQTRPRTSPSAPVPPPPPPGAWQTQVIPNATPDHPAVPDAGAEPDANAPDAEAPLPVDPLFDDRLIEGEFTGTWIHTPAPGVVSTESHTEQACTRLLEDATLPPQARALVLSGRARIRARMWHIDAALIDLDQAIELNGSAAQIRLVQAEILTCMGRTDDADSLLQQAFRLDPESTLTARMLGLIRFQQGNMDAAAEALRFHLEQNAGSGVADGDATLPLLCAIASGETGSLAAVDNASGPWPAQLAAMLRGRIDRATLLERARDPRGATPELAACTAWFYLAQRSLAVPDRDRATRDFLAAVRTGCTSAPEYRLAVAGLVRLGVLKADSLPGKLAP